MKNDHPILDITWSCCQYDTLPLSTFHRERRVIMGGLGDGDVVLVLRHDYDSELMMNDTWFHHLGGSTIVLSRLGVGVIDRITVSSRARS